MRWTVHGRRPVYESDWVSLWLDDVEKPGGHRYEHHVVRVPKEAAAVAVLDDHDQVLMLWRHRFFLDRWGWELPSGWIDPGEKPEEAARREVEEETGWRPGALTDLGTCNADNGLVQLRSHLFLARDAAYQGPPSDTDEAERIEWVPLADVPELVRSEPVQDAPSMIALLLAAHYA